MHDNPDTPITNLNEMYPWQVRHVYEGLDYPKVVLASVARQLERQLKQHRSIATLLKAKYKNKDVAKAYATAARKLHDKQRALLNNK